MKVVDRFKVGIGPQHIVPSWDLRTLWVTNNAEGRTDGSLTPIDPQHRQAGHSRCRSTTRTTCTSRPTASRRSWSPRRASGSTSATRRRWQLQYSIDTPGCPGINHADFSIDGRFAIFTCEFSGTLAKIDLVERKVLGYLQAADAGDALQGDAGRAAHASRARCGSRARPSSARSTKGMPQDIRISPDGKRFYIADMHADGVHIVDGAIVHAGRLHPHRHSARTACTRAATASACTWPTAARTRSTVARLGNGGVSVIDFATEKVVARWPVPGGGSPDMGNVSADGK